MQLEKEKLNVARENMKNDVEVAKINASKICSSISKYSRSGVKLGI